MNYYWQRVQERITIANTNQSTLQEQQQFLQLWECICGTCFVCIACLQVVKAVMEEEE